MYNRTELKYLFIHLKVPAIFAKRLIGKISRKILNQ